jgi:hypothetical protein
VKPPVKFEVSRVSYFDREAVIKALDGPRRRALNEMGRRIRKFAQKSLRYGDKSSPPGSPPTAHKSRRRKRTSRSTGKVRYRSVSFLREFMEYGYDLDTKSTVVGPRRLNGTADPDSMHRLEYGGSFQGKGRTFSVKNAVGRDAKGRYTSQGSKTVRLAGTIRIAPRPFMGPALQAEIPGFAPLWKDSVRP